MAINGLKGFGWFACGVIVAPACYLVSSQVAAERGKLEAVEQAIVQAHKDIRGLETEFDTRANLAQLERWNGDVLALAAPTPAQYLPNEAGLASLGQAPQIGNAVMVMPAAVTPPQDVVMAAASTVPVNGAAPVQTAQSAPAPAAKLQHAATPVRMKTQAVAMLDDKLLSDSTLGDLVKGARNEALTLR